jgi:hypothetical protein
MDADIRKLLEKNLATSQESLKILKKMHRATVVARVFKVLYWLMIMGITVGAYIYLKPYIIKLQEMIQRVSELQQNIPF